MKIKDYSIESFMRKFGTEKACASYFKRLKAKRENSIFTKEIPLKKWFLFLYLRKYCTSLDDLVILCDINKKEAIKMEKNINYALIYLEQEDEKISKLFESIF